MAIPVYLDHGGAGESGGAAVDVPYPSTVNADDILIVCVMDAKDDTFDVPAGWTGIGGYVNGNLSTRWYWKRAAGTESGTETFTSTGAAGLLVCGIMFRFSGCITSGTPYEGVAGAAPAQANTCTVETITTTGSDRLACTFIIVEDNVTIAQATGYTERAEVEVLTGSDAMLGCQTQDKATAGDVTGSTPALGGSDYSSTLTLALLPAGNGALPGSSVDTAALSDSVTAEASFRRLESATAGISDDASRAATYRRSLTGTVGLSDNVHGVIRHARVVADTVGLSDNVQKLLKHNRVVTDTAGLSDNVIASVTYRRTVSDTIGISDDAIAAATYTRTVTDTLGIADDTDWEFGGPLPGSSTDTAGLSDNVIASVKHRRSVTDTIGVNTPDLSDVTQIIEVVFGADTIGLSDAVFKDVQAGAIPGSAVDTVGVSDNVIATVKHRRSVIDTVGVSDNVIVAVTHRRVVTDTMGLSGDATAAITYRRTVTDTLGISDNVAGVKPDELDKSVTDTVGISDNVAATVTHRRAVADTLGISDSVLRAATYAAAVTDTLGISDSVAGAKADDFAKSVTDTIGVSDNVAATVTHRRIAIDTVGFQDALLRAGNYPRSVIDTIGVSDQVTASASYRRGPTTSAGMSDNVASFVVRKRTATGTAGISDNVTARVIHRRSVSSTIGFSDVELRGGTYCRSVVDALGIGDNVVSSYAAANAYYLREDGTASKVNAIGPTSDASKCMSVATFNAAWGTFSSGDTIYWSDKGGDYTTVTPLVRDDSITLKNAPDETPVIRRSTKLASGTSWTLSGSVYYTAVASIPDPTGCWVDSTLILAKGTDANLSPGEFWPDTANNLLYVRLADDTDPSLQDIYLGHNEQCLYLLFADDVTIDGLTLRHGSHKTTRQTLYCHQCANVTIKNVVMEYAADDGIRLYQCTGDNLIEDNTFRYFWNGKAYPNGGGTPLYYTPGTATSFTWRKNRHDYCYVGLALGAITDVAPLIEYNIITYSLVNGLSLGGTAALKHTVSHNTIHHQTDPNVIAGNGHAVVGRTLLGTLFVSNIILFVETEIGQEGMQIDEPDLEYFAPDYNCHHAITVVDGREAPQQIFNYWGTTSLLLSDWQAALVAAGYDDDAANSLQVNPGFVGDYAPTNPALRDAGHDGVTIGAVEYVQASTPYYYRMLA